MDAPWTSVMFSATVVLKWCTSERIIGCKSITTNAHEHTQYYTISPWLCSIQFIWNVGDSTDPSSIWSS